MIKRLIDIVGALIVTILLLPVLVLIGVAIKIDSRGPLFYRAWRMGRGVKAFRVLKFRSMIVSPREGGAITAPGDSRITRVGAWLRFFKVDELPQLWNVIVGEMSLVGPRPEALEIVEKYYSDEQKQVLTIRPGMTGIGQVIFFPDMTSEVPPGTDPREFYLRDQLPRKLAIDLMYVQKLSVLYDLQIMARTFYCLFFKSWWLLISRPPKELSRSLKQETLNR